MEIRVKFCVHQKMVGSIAKKLLKKKFRIEFGLKEKTGL